MHEAPSGFVINRETFSSLVLVGDFFRDELPVDKVLVDAFHGDELFVSSTLFNLTVLHYDDLVGVTDCAQSVSHNYDSLLA